MSSIFVDFEMSSVSKAHKDVRLSCKREIIEIGAVKLDEKGEEEDSFICYVKPQYGHISPYYENLTGISDDMVSNAPGFQEAVKRFLDWIGDDYVIYSWSDSDEDQLRKEAAFKGNMDPRFEEMFEHWIDYQKEFGKLLGIDKQISLKDAVHAIDREFTGQQHDALWDARNTAYIYKLSLNPKEFNKTMKSLIDLFKPKNMSTSLGELFGSEFSKLL